MGHRRIQGNHKRRENHSQREEPGTDAWLPPPTGLVTKAPRHEEALVSFKISVPNLPKV